MRIRFHAKAQMKTKTQRKEIQFPSLLYFTALDSSPKNRNNSPFISQAFFSPIAQT
jgi:hypothetical protein